MTDELQGVVDPLDDPSKALDLGDEAESQETKPELEAKPQAKPSQKVTAEPTTPVEPLEGEVEPGEELEEGGTEEVKQKDLDYLDRLNAMAASIFTRTSLSRGVESEVKPIPATPVEAPVVAKPETQTIDFIGGQDLDLGDPVVINQLLNKVFQLGRQDTYRSVPGMVDPIISNKIAMGEMVRDFYTRNPDLAKYRALVGSIALELQEKNPSWGTSELFNETEKEFRSRHNMARLTGDESEKRSPRKPRITPARQTKVVPKDNFELDMSEL